MNRILSVIQSLLAVLLTASCNEKADMVIRGRIFTSDDALPYASEVAVKDGKIIYVGESAASMIDDNTYVIDAPGLVTAGFTDGHAHGASGLRLLDVAASFPSDSAAAMIREFRSSSVVDSLKTEYILNFQKYLLSSGITSYMDAATDIEGFDLSHLYEELDRKGKLAVHTYGVWKITPETTFGHIDSIAASSTAIRGGRFEINAVELMVDSTISGPAIWAERQLDRAIEKMSSVGFGIHAHAVGGDAVGKAVYLLGKSGDRTLCNSITHLAAISKDDLSKMAAYGISAVVQPSVFHRDSSLGDSAAVVPVYPVKSLLDSKVNVSISSNFPVSRSISIPESIYMMVFRRGKADPDSAALSVEEGISVSEALKCATIGGARQFGRDSVSGSVSVGKDADLVILDRDITTCCADSIPGAEVLYTIIGGKVVFRRSDTL